MDDIKTMNRHAQKHFKKIIEKQQGEDAMERLRAGAMKRGISGIMDFVRTFTDWDDDHNKVLDMEEFKRGVKELEIDNLEDSELEELFERFDADKSRKINFKEFLAQFQPPLSDQRKKWIEMAFNKLDKNGNKFITTDELVEHFNFRKINKVKSGDMTEEEAVKDLLETFNATDGKIMEKQFYNFYAGISLIIEKDPEFHTILKLTYRI